MGKIDFSIGEFDTRIRFYQQQNTRTDAGAVVKDFMLVSDAFAQIVPKTLDETIGSEQVRIIEVLEITTYLLSVMDNSWRVGINDEVYEVISVESMKRRFMRIVCKKL